MHEENDLITLDPYSLRTHNVRGTTTMTVTTHRIPERVDDAGSREGWLGRAEQAILLALRRFSLPALRIALGIVFIWFGALKLIGATPIADLVTAVMPFLPEDLAVVGLGVFEALVGLGMIVGRFLPWLCALMVGHLTGTFLIFFVRPDLAYDGNPLFLTMEGEFAAKNMVLIAASLVVAAFCTRPEENPRY